MPFENKTAICSLDHKASAGESWNFYESDAFKQDLLDILTHEVELDVWEERKIKNMKVIIKQIA